jgi:RimJ/RimL family protein N-acetyltransferase
MKIILETERLRLREMVPDDLDFLAEVLAHPEVMRFYPKQYSRAEAQEWLDRQCWRYAEHGHGLWLVLDRATDEPVGQVGLALQEVDGKLEPEIGYMIHHPFWRKGFASEAALGVRQYAFERLGLARVISLIRPENEPSRGVARKLGMTVERATLFKDIPHLVYAVRRVPPPDS